MQDKETEMNDGARAHNYTGAILFIICFVIGCLFLYWAVEYWVYNTFDSKRYTITKIQVGASDTLSIWKLDNRTGDVQYCTQSYDKIERFICVRPVIIDAQEYKPAEAKPEAAAPAAKAPEPAAAPNASDPLAGITPRNKPAVH